MISRHWTGIAKSEEAANYISHLQTDIFPKLALINGFVRASILSREVDVGTEFLIVTDWDSLDAIKAFAGQDVEEAVVPAVVQSMMIEFDSKVRHYEIAAQSPKR